MSARKTRRITRLRSANEQLYKDLMVLIDDPESAHAQMIRSTYLMMRRYKSDVQKMIWFGSYSPKS